MSQRFDEALQRDLVLVHQPHTQPEGRLQSADAERSIIELAQLLDHGVRRVVRPDAGGRPELGATSLRRR